MNDRWTDKELEGLWRKAFQNPADPGAASSAVVAAVMNQVCAASALRPAPAWATGGAAEVSPLNTLALALAAGLALGWAGTGLWSALGPGFRSLVEGAYGGLIEAALRWTFGGLVDTARILLLVGFGDAFPLLLLGTLGVSFAAARPGRAAR
jgi:hypothetical protein